MSSPILGFGIVGTGSIAHTHAQAIASLPNARVVGVSSRSQENAHAFASKHGIVQVTATAAELAAREDIDVIAITTPSGAHLDVALDAIRAGKHVVIEKPLEITTARVDELLLAADQAGVRVAAIFQARFGDGARTVKAAIEAGRLGRLVLASAYIKWHRPASYYTGWKGTRALDGGAVLINQAIHGLDALQWFAGMPGEVFCRTARLVHTDIESEDTAVATLRYANGALGTVEATTAIRPGWARRIELCGETGSICLEDDRITRWDFATAQPEDESIRAGKSVDALGSGSASPTAISLTGHIRQYEDICAALLENRPFAIEGREGRKAVAFVNALYASAESGRPVTL
ncbi:Gfo/Idh/MocA family protein [Oleiharenicola lentus]|uniref:Gfo/Idh/MocA family protein n=1 Tax=Oleiharenicola lentus TaxID=2508720 RepID=UPI003F67B119